MPLAAPKLDDRHFQDLVDEAKKKIPHYNKEWTDHNVSDPGVTLIELFAWMTDVLLYRLNQVPDLHYIKFLDLLGITLQGPIAAQAPVSFWLSAPQPTPVLVPAGTEVSSTQTETDRPIIFTTDEDFRITPPVLANIIARVAASDPTKKVYRPQNLRRLDAGFEGFEVFSPVPQVDDALYFGFENDLSYHLLGFEMEFDPAGGAGIDPTLPPYIWEASTGKTGDASRPDSTSSRWERCEVDMDTTRGMNGIGRIRIHLPSMGKYKVNDIEQFWVRARVKEISAADERDGMHAYRLSPRLRKVQVASWGCTVQSTNAQKVVREFLGQSDGSPGQRFSLKASPILERKKGEHLTVQVEGSPAQAWAEVSDFSESNSTDLHYTLDSNSGELRFGPAVRQQDGTIKLYGAVPGRGANLIFEKYRFGGGQEGNLQPKIINTLKTAIPFISQVANRQPGWGGLDAETLASAMMRAPAMLRSRDRAVTEADFEFLARQSLPAAIGRVKCLQPSPADASRVVPGQVYILVIPKISRPEGRLEQQALSLKPEDIAALTAFLDERRLLTTRLDIRPPAYQWVAVKVKLRAAPGADQAVVESEVLKRLYKFLNPLTGGSAGDGWPFGRELFISDVYQCLQGIPNILFVRSVEMFASRPTGEPLGEAVESLEILAHGVVASGIHSVEFI